MSEIETKETQLPKSVYLLMKMIWNVKKMNRTMKELHFDTSKNPLGKLSMMQI
jgi:poly [ADP-ribose] polymerase